MKLSFLDVMHVREENQRFKVYAIGQPDYHITDWAGCNFRRAAIAGQPRHGFDTIEEARAFKESLDVKEIQKLIRYTNGGSFAETLSA